MIYLRYFNIDNKEDEVAALNVEDFIQAINIAIDWCEQRGHSLILVYDTNGNKFAYQYGCKHYPLLKLKEK